MSSPKAGEAAPSAFAQRGWELPFELDPSQRLGYEEAIHKVEAALRLGIDPSLEPVEALLDELGRPDRAFRSVQVAGTNGKTSTSRYTATLLSAGGLRCGLYTSPHLVEYTERVEVDGAPVSREAFARGVSAALAAWSRLCSRDSSLKERGCTEFELLTAAAMAMFAEARVDAAVLEVGLGGRWDATSAVDACASAVTGIGLDHMQVLGDTLEAIAGEKAAVIRPGRPCVLGTNAVRPASVLGVMLERCRQAGVVPTAVVEEGTEPSGLPDEALALPRASFHITRRPKGIGDVLEVDASVEASLPDGRELSADYPHISWRAPRYQAQNAACALALATAFLGRPLGAEAAREAVRSCRVPGRFEVVRERPLVVLDACHNPQSAAAFAQAVEDAEPDRSKRPLLLLGALADKDHGGIVRTVAPLFDRIAVTRSLSPRSLDPAVLASEAEQATGREVEAVYPSAQAALDALYGESFVGCGTITLIGELAGLLK